MLQVDLICLPFAGGNKYSYVPYQHLLPSGLCMKVLELPGRGDRYHETLLTDIESMVGDLYAQLQKEIRGPYAIFGHSMGAILSYLLLKRIVADRLPQPRHLFVSGSRGPAVKRRLPQYHKLPKDQFVERLRTLGGCPEEILVNKEIMDLYEPILRADFQAIETYEYQAGKPLSIPTTVLLGTEDEVTLEDGEAWQQQTNFKIQLNQFSGDHFFIFKHREKVLQIVTRTLLNN